MSFLQMCPSLVNQSATWLCPWDEKRRWPA